jgi:hypothetical protein
MGYSRSIFVLLGMWLAACAPAAPARSAAPAPPASNVSLVMIDGPEWVPQADSTTPYHRVRSFVTGDAARVAPDPSDIAWLKDSGYTCEASDLLKELHDVHPDLGPVLGLACGLPDAYSNALLASAQHDDNAERAFANVEKAMALAVHSRTVSPTLKNVVGQVLDRERSAPQHLAELARRLAGSIPLDVFPEFNVRLRVVAIAADVLAKRPPAEHPGEVLFDAQRHQSSQDTTLLRRLIYKPADVAATAATARSTLGIPAEPSP